MIKDLSKLYIAEKLQLDQDSEAPQSLLDQVYETVHRLLSADSFLIEDSVDDMDSEPSFESLEEFKPEHIFSEQIGFIYFDEEPPSYQVRKYGIEGKPDFSLTRIMLPADGNPVGCYFLGDTTAYVSFAGEYFDSHGFISESLNTLTFLMEDISLAPHEKTPAETIAKHPEGEFVKYCADHKSLRALPGILPEG